MTDEEIAAIENEAGKSLDVIQFAHRGQIDAMVCENSATAPRAPLATKVEVVQPMAELERIVERRRRDWVWRPKAGQ